MKSKWLNCMCGEKYHLDLQDLHAKDCPLFKKSHETKQNRFTIQPNVPLHGSDAVHGPG